MHTTTLFYSSSGEFVPQASAYPVLTPEIHKTTEKLVKVASSIYERTLTGSRANRSSHFSSSSSSSLSSIFNLSHWPSTQRSVNFDFSDRSVNIGSSRTNISSTGGRESREKKDDSNLKMIVGVIGCVVALAASYLAGKVIAQREDDLKEVENFKSLKNYWEFNTASYYEKDHDIYRKAVQTVIDKTSSILQREETNRTHKLAMLVFTFIAGFTALVGALFASKAIMASAVVIGTATAAAVLFKLGYACFSNRDKNNAQIIEDKLRIIGKEPFSFADPE